MRFAESGLAVDFVYRRADSTWGASWKAPIPSW